MNDYDKHNFNFIMNTDPAGLRTWYAEASEDDIKYAFELIKAAQVEVEMQLADLLDQDYVGHTDDADYVILEIMSKIDNK